MQFGFGIGFQVELLLFYINLFLIFLSLNIKIISAWYYLIDLIDFKVEFSLDPFKQQCSHKTKQTKKTQTKQTKKTQTQQTSLPWSLLTWKHTLSCGQIQVAICRLSLSRISYHLIKTTISFLSLMHAFVTRSFLLQTHSRASCILELGRGSKHSMQCRYPQTTAKWALPLLRPGWPLAGLSHP